MLPIVEDFINLYPQKLLTDMELIYKNKIKKEIILYLNYNRKKKFDFSDYM